MMSGLLSAASAKWIVPSPSTHAVAAGMRGVYLYEACKRLPRFGVDLLAAAANHITIDKRRMLGARGFDVLWMIARRTNSTNFWVLTEGMYLALHHSERTITTETPSEYDLGQRIRAQVAMVQRAIELSVSRGA
jgi:hypothetical protein